MAEISFALLTSENLKKYGAFSIKQTEVVAISMDHPISIRLDSGTRVDGTVSTQDGAVQIAGPDGHITTIGSFQLTGGYGYWGSPDPVTNGPLTGARLVTTTGAVLATATFPT